MVWGTLDSKHKTMPAVVLSHARVNLDHLYQHGICLVTDHDCVGLIIFP